MDTFDLVMNTFGLVDIMVVKRFGDAHFYAKKGFGAQFGAHSLSGGTILGPKEHRRTIMGAERALWGHLWGQKWLCVAHFGVHPLSGAQFWGTSVVCGAHFGAHSLFGAQLLITLLSAK